MCRKEGASKNFNLWDRSYFLVVFSLEDIMKHLGQFSLQLFPPGSSACVKGTELKTQSLKDLVSFTTMLWGLGVHKNEAFL